MTAGLFWITTALVSGVGSAGLFAYAALDAVFGRTAVQRRLRMLRRYRAGPKPPKPPALSGLRGAGARVVASVPALSRYAARAEPALERAAVHLPPDEWLGIRLGAGLTAALLLAVVAGWPGLVSGAALGFAAPAALLRRRIARRARDFADELPNTLQLVLSSLRAGFTLMQSVEAAVRDDEGPVAEELLRAVSEARLNGDFEDALQRVGERVGSLEVTWLVMAIRLQREVGGSLAEVLQTTAETMRERAFLRRHVRSLSAEGRFSAWILGVMPVLAAAVMFLTRPDYIGPLFTEPIGLALVTGTVALMVVGVFWLRASIRIEI